MLLISAANAEASEGHGIDVGPSGPSVDG